MNVFFFRAEGFSCSLNVLYGGLEIGKLQFLIKKILNFFSAVIFFPIFGHQNPGSWSVFSLKCWIPIKWIRMRDVIQCSENSWSLLGVSGRPCLSILLVRTVRSFLMRELSCSSSLIRTPPHCWLVVGPAWVFCWWEQCGVSWWGSCPAAAPSSELLLIVG